MTLQDEFKIAQELVKISADKDMLASIIKRSKKAGKTPESISSIIDDYNDLKRRFRSLRNKLLTVARKYNKKHSS